jgi:uncharacterized protein YqgV (UPF0045/DUF77 family)
MLPGEAATRTEYTVPTETMLNLWLTVIQAYGTRAFRLVKKLEEYLAEGTVRDDVTMIQITSVDEQDRDAEQP